MIERLIIIGLITSTEFLKKIRPVWDPMLMESSTARMLSGWVITYYDKYKQAPNRDIEIIFFKKVKEGLDKEIAEEIEEDILPDLSEEHTDKKINIDTLYDDTIIHLNTQKYLLLSEQIENILENTPGSFEERIEKAEELRKEFKPITIEIDDSIDLSKKESLPRIEKAFKDIANPIVKWPKQLGQFWNHQFVAGSFISFLAPEKRGKTFWLLEIAMRTAKQGKNVAFFQAGDMNEAEQLKRIAVYLCKRSNLEKYCTEHYEPVRDCILNQMDECTKKERECDFGIFMDKNKKEIKNVEMSELIEAFQDYPDYKACYNCKQYNLTKNGVPWLILNSKVDPIEVQDATEAIKEFFFKHKRRFKLSTHANGTLSVDKMISILDRWEEEDGFVADEICADYADIMLPSIKTEFRHQQNQIWKDLRRLSQTPRQNILPLVIAPTQSDSPSYKKHRLGLDNFSEDKRKYGHVTAMYGLNQDPDGKEKKIGITRINEIVIREGEFFNDNEVTILQNLRQGRPFKQSFF